MLALLTAPMLWLHPVSDGIRFGQVNAFMVLACLMDLRQPRPGLLRRIPAGVLVGLAMSIKLTPGVFVVHYLVNRRWREAALGRRRGRRRHARHVRAAAARRRSRSGAARCRTPTGSGPTRGTSNQSLRGFLLRVGPDGAAGTALWLACVVVVGVVGLRARPARLPARATRSARSPRSG